MTYRPLTRRFWPGIAVLGFLALARPMWTVAQTLMGDPTRPPASVLRAMSPVQPTATTPAAPAAPASAASAASGVSARARPAGLRVTLIRLDEGSNRRVALVQGRFVNVGDHIGEWTVAGIDAQGVTLRGVRGAYRLWLLSSTDQEAAAPAVSAAASGGEKESP